MTFRIFPTSPLPADFTRTPQWNESGTEYDSGLGQYSTALSKPLYDFGFVLRNAPDSKQSSLEFFINDGKGRLAPFWIKDPYHHINNASGAVVINTGQVSVNSFLFRNVESYHYWPDSATFSGAYSSMTSGTLIFGTDYHLDQETGTVTFSLQADSDDWFTYVGTQEYFKKAVFNGPWRFASPRVFNQFNISGRIRERAR
jgi:hypothetical protein